MDLVLNIGAFRIKGAFFEGDTVAELFSCSLDPNELKTHLEHRHIDHTLVCSINPSAEKHLHDLLPSFEKLDFSTVHVHLDVEEPDQLTPDRIANVYGALYRFPRNDCVVVDMGEAITFDCIGCEGRFVGGAIYPGVKMGAEALAAYSSSLPTVTPTSSVDPVAKTTQTHIQSGLYWGLLGAIERITFEMRTTAGAPSDIKVLATGGLINELGEPFVKDLTDIVDLIDPALTLIGLHEIMKEKNKHDR